MRKIRQSRLRTKLWRIELTLAVLAHLLKNGESTVAELKCFVHIPPDVIRRKERTRSPAAGSGKITTESAKSDQLSQILWQLCDQGYVGKIRVGKANVYDCTEQTQSAYDAYRKVLEKHQG
jgi:hypothetical protein